LCRGRSGGSAFQAVKDCTGGGKRRRCGELFGAGCEERKRECTNFIFPSPIPAFCRGAGSSYLISLRTVVSQAEIRSFFHISLTRWGGYDEEVFHPVLWGNRVCRHLRRSGRRDGPERNALGTKRHEHGPIPRPAEQWSPFFAGSDRRSRCVEPPCTAVECSRVIQPEEVKQCIVRSPRY